MARVSDGIERDREAGTDREQKIAGIRERGERRLVKHLFVEDPENFAARPPGQADRQADPGAALPCLSRPGCQAAAHGGEDREHEQAVIRERLGDRITAPLPDQRSGERKTDGDSADPHPRCSRHRLTLATNWRRRNPCSKLSVTFAYLLSARPLCSRSCANPCEGVLPKLTAVLDVNCSIKCQQTLSGVDQGSLATSSSTPTRGPVKNGVSSRTCRRASVARKSRIRSTMRCSSGASNARIHS